MEGAGTVPSKPIAIQLIQGSRRVVFAVPHWRPGLPCGNDAEGLPRGATQKLERARIAERSLPRRSRPRMIESPLNATKPASPSSQYPPYD